MYLFRILGLSQVTLAWLQDQTRVRYSISRIIPLEYREEACALRDLLQSHWGR
jgi:hypothetical protein